MSQTGSSAVWRDSKPWLSELMGRSRCGRRSARQPSWTRNSAALIMKLWPSRGETSTVAPKYSGFKPQDWLCLTASSEKLKDRAHDPNKQYGPPVRSNRVSPPLFVPGAFRVRKDTDEAPH